MSPNDKPRLLQVLADHIGARAGASAQALAAAVYGHTADAQQQRRIRQLVVELRQEGHHICAHPSTGYYIAESDDDLERTCTFLYLRAMTSLAQISAMKRVSLPDLAGQLNIRLEDSQL